MNAYLACFDISDDRTRDRLARLLGRYGLRVQRSVFEVSFRDPGQLERLRQAVEELDLEPGDDVRFYALCRACRGASCDVQGRRIARFPSAVVL